jgi:cytoskeletal protein CcmA (bactofilin family)
MFLRQHAPAASQPATPTEKDPPPTVQPAQRPIAAVGATAAPKLAEPPQSMTEPPDAALNPSRPGGRAAADEGNGKRLIVGDGIRLKGEITACDRLIVEGYVEVTLNDTRTLEIKPSGCFIGSCEVEDAEISGTYEGDLTVRGRLVIRTSGRITGRIRYGELELERGGQIAGELTVRPPDGQTPWAKAEAPRRAGNAA